MEYTNFQEVALESTSGEYSLAVHTGIISIGNHVLIFLWLICNTIFSVFIHVGKIFHLKQKLSFRGMYFSISCVVTHIYIRTRMPGSRKFVMF
jgi:hypothetical protein